MKTCRRGSILRKGYLRHLKNKTVRVPSGCIRVQSQMGIKRTAFDKAIMRKTQKMHERIRHEFGTPVCREGEVVREGYERPAYMRKSGTYVSSTKVRPGCIRAVGMSKKRGRKGRQLFVLQKGTLTQYGYHADKDKLGRHDALERALTHMKPLSVYRKLNALYVLNKNKNPKMADLFRGDADWVKTRPEYMNRPM
jgi:Family of unknown function (DUF5771)